MAEHETNEIMELTHEPVPGYRAIFAVAITVGSLYLGIILCGSIF
jgi:hypothetical protein